jgi:molecular chaperone GrpE
MTLEEQQSEQQEAAAAEGAGARATNGNENAEAQPRQAPATEGAAAEGAGTPEPVAQQTTPDLTAELEREREKASDYMNRWQRAQADLANYKRRAEQEREQERKYALAPLFLELLKIQDNFHRAFDTLPVELREFSWVQGVALTYAHVDGLLRLYGVTPLETKPGEPFDPARHEAVTHEETDAYPDGTITTEYQRGYQLHDRVLRPSLVRVAKAKSAESTKQEEPADQPAPSDT